MSIQSSRLHVSVLSTKTLGNWYNFLNILFLVLNHRSKKILFIQILFFFFRLIQVFFLCKFQIFLGFDISTLTKMNTLVVICALFASSSALSEHDNGHDDHDEHEPDFSTHFRGGGGLEGSYFFGGELEDGDKAPDEDESSVNAVVESFEPGIHPLNNAFGPPPPPTRGRR